MVTKYKDASTGLRPYTIPDDILAEMGRLIRGCAELEDVVTIILCSLAKIGEEDGLLLFPRLSISAKIDAIEQYTKLRGGSYPRRHKKWFAHPYFAELIRTRDTIAYGVFLGLADDASLVFKINHVSGFDDHERDRGTARAISSNSFRIYAKHAELFVSGLEFDFNVIQTRDAFRNQDVRSHPR
jgi:hypothetical protein